MQVSREGSLGTVGVVGLGVVGGTLADVLAEARVPVRGFDSYRGIGRPEELGDCSVIFLCVPTPAGEEEGYDLTEVWSAMCSIAPHLRLGTVVAVKSTVPPGTSDALSARFPELEFASVPEFLVAHRPRETLTDPDRLVVGCRSEDAASRILRAMRCVAPTAPRILLSPVEAELVKLCSNAMLAAKVTVANELYDVCARFGVRWSDIQTAVGLDHRIGEEYLDVTTERGFGGACLPKDLSGLIVLSIHAGHDPSILKEIDRFNRRVRRDRPAFATLEPSHEGA